MALELLRAAAAAATGPAPDGLPPGILRYSLEYEKPANVAAEKKRIAELLGKGKFDLRALPDDAQILVLQFPGVVREQSASFLFSEGHALADALDLVSATPDVDPGWIEADELARDMPESVRGLVGAVCESHVAPPTDQIWSIQSIRADKAWAKGANGEGILVAQPDTGVADHRELDLALDVGKGTNILAGGGPPVDPLTETLGNPGHGTATGSCVASRRAGLIAGSAPGATVVPVRCVDAVVLTSGASVAAAIDHARNEGCNVITMSLGGPVPWPDLKRAIKRAVDADMIVCAAAGNCIQLVVYPAWDANVISVAGIDRNDKRWKGSSHGSKIDIAAPAEHVYVARRSTPTDLDHAVVVPGQGTSFAVALTAGCAALWLQHHGVEAVRAAARAKKVNVQEMFRAALRQSARKPAGWPRDMGPGVVDAGKLIDLALADIAPKKAKEGLPLPDLGSAFNWAKFGTEAAYLAIDSAQRQDPTRIAALESPVAPRPSPQLREAMQSAGKSPYQVFGAPPAIINGPLTPDLTVPGAISAVADRAVRAARRQSSARGAVTESAARSYLEGSGGKAALDHLESMTSGGAKGDDRVRALRAELLESAPRAIAHIAAGKPASTLKGPSRVALEALVRLTGRPALRLTKGAIDIQDPQLGDWGPVLVPQARWKPLFDSVGRIDLQRDGEFIHVGTGTVVAPGIVMTNRHVLDALAEPIPLPGGKTRFELIGPVSISFDETPGDKGRRFRLTEVKSAGKQKIGQQADVRKLDMAFFAMESTNAQGGKAPGPVDASRLSGGSILVVGYPARPGVASYTDPKTNKASAEMLDRLFEIFGNRYGEKYASPGELGDAPLASDQRHWGFSHDATSLPGHSGSAVFDIETRFIAGLHFGGAPLKLNLAHNLDAVRAAAVADKVIDPAIFGAMTWK